jgi:hypothetical protein
VSEETARECTEPREIALESVRAVRIGHGANCSSVGSVIDTLFLGAVAGGAIFAAVCAAMKVEPVTVVGRTEDDDAARVPEEDGPP